MHSELSLLEQVKLEKIWDFPGGIHPSEQKSLSNQTPITSMPMSGRYFVPIKQHIGSTDDIIVAVGDHVLANQPLTAANLTMTVPVHAPVSGKISAIAPHVSAHPSAKPELCVMIDADEQQQTAEPSPLNNWQKAEKHELVEQFKKMGLSGMGGAGFPTHIKMHPAKPIELLILNGVECEPYITSDDVLMREHAEEIVLGAQILQYTVNTPLCIVAVEDNKPEAIEALKHATKECDNVEVRVVPTKYPSGGEKQLIQLLTGMQVPSGGIPADLGIVMQNVGTAFAVKQAVVDGLPLTQRVVTLTGEALAQPQNVWAKLGAPISDLLDFAELKPEKDQRLIMGGPMMGFTILDPSMPVVKTTNCILAPSARKLPPQGDEQACIRCGLCADACPAELLPQQLQWFSKAKDHEKLNDYNLFDCIECGACAYVCPSQIPLVQYYRTSKAEIREAEQEKIKSDKAKVRFEQRQERLEREKAARLAKHKASAEKRAQALNKDTGAKDKIAAALARAKAKKEAAAAGKSDSAEISKPTEASAPKPVSSTNSVEPKQADKKPAASSNKDRVAAAIARAKAKKAEREQSSEKQGSEEQSTGEKAPVAKAPIEKAPGEKAKQTSEQQTPSENPNKDRVAAAIARAKAKKAEREQGESAELVNSTPEQTNSDSNQQATSNNDSEAERKAKIAAAIAKAKARKAKSE